MTILVNIRIATSRIASCKEGVRSVPVVVNNKSEKSDGIRVKIVAGVCGGTVVLRLYSRDASLHHSHVHGLAGCCFALLFHPGVFV